MHLSEARQALYDQVFAFMHKEDRMSRLPHKHGYSAGETVELSPFEWTTAKVGYLTEVKVIYRTGDGKLETLYEQVPDNRVNETVKEMLSRTSITYPE